MAGLTGWMGRAGACADDAATEPFFALVQRRLGKMTPVEHEGVHVPALVV